MACLIKERHIDERSTLLILVDCLHDRHQPTSAPPQLSRSIVVEEVEVRIIHTLFVAMVKTSPCIECRPLIHVHSRCDFERSPYPTRLRRTQPPKPRCHSQRDQHHDNRVQHRHITTAHRHADRRLAFSAWSRSKYIHRNRCE